MDRCSEPTSRAAPGAQRDFHLGSALGSNRTGPTDAGSDIETDQVGFTKRIGLWWDAQPNGSRLSCGALKKDSFHNLRAPAASSAC